MGIVINYAEATKSIDRIDVLTAMDQACVGEFVSIDGKEDNSALHYKYTGRGYAEPGWGIVGNQQECFKFLAILAENLMNESWEARGNAPEESAAELAGSARMDSMGLDQIMYFPGWKLHG